MLFVQEHFAVRHYILLQVDF